MTKECSEEKHEAVNRHAVAALETLLKESEGKWGDEQYETEFLGDLYARMIVSVYMGYFPHKMGEDAEAGAVRLMELNGVNFEETEDDQGN